MKRQCKLDSNLVKIAISVFIHLFIHSHISAIINFCTLFLCLAPHEPNLFDHLWMSWEFQSDTATMVEAEQLRSSSIFIYSM